eukprot:scaffold1863_cov85-Cylindrotheca_fusiformis.AAC.11
MKFQSTLLAIFLSFIAAATLSDAQCEFKYACDPDGRGHDLTSSVEDESSSEEEHDGDATSSGEEYGNGVTSSVDSNTGFFVCRSSTNNSTESMCVESDAVLSTDTCGCCNGKCPEMVTVLKSALESSAMESFSGVAIPLLSLLSLSTAMVLGL